MMSNEQIAQAMNDVYNAWWLKWRDVPLTNQNLDRAAQEGYEIIRKYQATELVTHMVNELVRILEHRAKEESTYVMSNMRL